MRASSRVRWATSMVKVLAIRKTPTKRAIPAKTSRMVLRPLSPASVCLASSSASAAPVWASAFSGSRGFTASSSCRSEAPASAVTVTSLNWPGFRKSCWAVPVSKRTRLPPALTAPSSVVKTPERVYSFTGPVVATRTGSPTRYLPRFAVSWSRATCPSSAGPPPSVKTYCRSLPSVPGAKLDPVLDQPLPMSLPSGSATPANPETRPVASATPSSSRIFRRVASLMAEVSSSPRSAQVVTATATWS